MKTWHGVKKLSLENGDDKDVVTEQLAWMLNMLAENTIYPAGHMPGMANYATLTAHIVDQGSNGLFEFQGTPGPAQYLGLYVNVEQPDKQFLKNRGVWVSDQTYLYKAGLNSEERKEVGCEDLNDEALLDSPTWKELDCKPFRTGKNIRDCTEEEMSSQIDMNAMLSMGAIEAFMSSPDDLFSKGKNYYFVDFTTDSTCNEADGLRIHYQWDLDAAFQSVTQNVYTKFAGSGGNPGKIKNNGKRRLGKPGPQTPYQEVIFGCQTFLNMFNEKLEILLDDSAGSIVDQAKKYLEIMKPTLVPLLEDDGNIRAAISSLDLLQTWLTERQAIVREQICDDSASSGMSCS